MAKATALLLSALIGVPITVSLLSEPLDITVTDQGQPDGTYQQVKAAIQGKRYWDKQLELVLKERQDWIDLPEAMRQLQARPADPEPKSTPNTVQALPPEAAQAWKLHKEIQAMQPPEVVAAESRADILRREATRLTEAADRISAEGWRLYHIRRLGALAQLLSARVAERSSPAPAQRPAARPVIATDVSQIPK